MSDPSREQRINRAFVAVAGALTDQYDVVDLLAALVQECTELLSISAGGLLVADSMGELELIASTSEDVEFVEIMQLAAGAGPCVDCFISGTQISVNDIEVSGSQWPAFRAAALRKGFRSLHATPLRFRGKTIGSLNLLGTAAGELTIADADLAQALADVAVIGILQERTHRDAHFIDAQLHLALDTRILIEQAKGVLAHTEKMALEDAFSAIRAYSRTKGLSTRAVAQSIIDRSLAGSELTAALPVPSRLEKT